MKACVLTDWKELKIMEVPRPVPKCGQVLIRVKYAGVCGSDVNVFNHNHPTATVPRIMCHEIYGVVEEINCADLLPYGKGSRVVVCPLTWCGTCEACRQGAFHVCRNLGIMGLHLDGGFAEYVAVDADMVFPIPDDIPDEIAILTEPFAVGFHLNMRAGTAPGDTVLISGGGPIGLLAAMNARYFRASRVVVSEPNPERRANVASFGFEVLDPMEQDIVKEAMRITDGVGFDKVIEASGSAAAWKTITDVCKIRGVIAPVGIPKGYADLKVVQLIFKELTIVGSRVYEREHFARTIDMLVELYRSETWDLSRVIDRMMPLDQLAEAIEFQSSGKNKGKIVIEI